MDAEEDDLASFGPGFKWDEATLLLDAAAQAFSLCLKWHLDGERLTSIRLKTIQKLWKRQVNDSSSLAGSEEQQLFSALLLQHLLGFWDNAERKASTEVCVPPLISCRPSRHSADNYATVQEPPQQAAARTRYINKLTASITDFWEQKVLESEAEAAPGTTSVDGGTEGSDRAVLTAHAWRCAHAAEYCQFIMEHATHLHRTVLGVSPLKHVLGHYAGPFLPGLWLEFGVAEGRTLGLIAASLPRHIAAGTGVAGGVVYGFDSFDGLPESWRPGFSAGHFQRIQAPSFAPEVVPQLELVHGWFQDSLPAFLEAHPEPVAMLHMDSDLYSSSAYVLRELLLAGRIERGTVIVFDELFHYCGFECHEFLALFEVRPASHSLRQCEGW